MAEAKLGGDNKDVIACLLQPKLLESACFLRLLAKALRTKLTFTVVLELAVAGLLDQVEYLLHRFVVGRGDLVPSWDGEPAFGPLRYRLARERHIDAIIE